MKITRNDDVRELLRGCGLPLQRITKAAGVPYAALWEFINGGSNPKLSTILKLLDAAGFNVEITRRRKG